MCTSSCSDCNIHVAGQLRYYIYTHSFSLQGRRHLLRGHAPPPFLNVSVFTVLTPPPPPSNELTPYLQICGAAFGSLYSCRHYMYTHSCTIHSRRHYIPIVCTLIAALCIANVIICTLSAVPCILTSLYVHSQLFPV